MSYARPLVEQYRVTRFAHIERRQDAFNQECNVINDVTGKSHSTHATMEGAKHSLNKLDLKLMPNVDIVFDEVKGLEGIKKTLKKLTLKLA
jgi:translation initiation factor 2 alpha subunit (eIF-2alpha)